MKQQTQKKSKRKTVNKYILKNCVGTEYLYVVLMNTQFET